MASLVWAVSCCARYDGQVIGLCLTCFRQEEEIRVGRWSRCVSCLRMAPALVFCGHCGSRLYVDRVPCAEGVEEQASFRARMAELREHETSTVRAKEGILKQFFDFLSRQGVLVPAEDPLRALGQVTPTDVTMFLSVKDVSGRTVVHVSSCPQLGKGAKRASGVSCGCPRRMAASSLDTYRGRLQAIFRDAGFGERWNPQLGSGNPCASPLLDEYLRLAAREQAAAGVSEVQSTLIGQSVFDGMVLLWRKAGALMLRERREHVAAETARDCFLVALMWHTGLRAADALRLTVQQVTSVSGGAPGDLLIQVGVTKTSSAPHQVHGIVVRQSEGGSPGDLYSCLNRWRDALSHLGLSLSPGPLFKTLVFMEGECRSVWGSRLEWQEANLRFRAWCRLWGIPEGVTLHSLHGSRAAREAAMGIPREETCKNMRWSAQSYAHYVDGRTPLQMELGWSPPPCLGSPSTWLSMNGLEVASRFAPEEVLDPLHTWVGDRRSSGRRAKGRSPRQRRSQERKRKVSRYVSVDSEDADDGCGTCSEFGSKGASPSSRYKGSDGSFDPEEDD